MRRFDRMRQEQLKPSAPPTAQDLGKGTTPLAPGASTQKFNDDFPKTGGLNQSGTSSMGSRAAATNQLNGAGKTNKF